MLLSFDMEPFDIKTIKEFTLDTVLNLPDVTALFYVNKDYLKSEEEKQKFSEFETL